MNSITSTKLVIGAKFYVPFWVLLEFLDATPPNPFIEVVIISIDTKYGTNPDGPVRVLCCDLMCNGKRQLVANNIPAEYLIAPDNLREWADKIADWFSDFQASAARDPDRGVIDSEIPDDEVPF